MTFDEAFEKVVGYEGKFDKDERDDGNWTGGAVGNGELKGTKYGICAAAYPDLDIENLTLDEAKALYRRDRWDVLRIEEMVSGVRYDVFDFAVNSGVKRAAKMLQSAVKVVADGDVGPATLAAVNSFPPDLLDKRLMGVRLKFLVKCKNFPVFGPGWISRCADILLTD